VKPRNCGFHEVPPKNTELLQKFALIDKKGFELTEMRKRRQKKKKKKKSCPLVNPPLEADTMSMVWNIPISQLGCLPGCAPSQLLHTGSSAEHQKPKKVLDFLATTKNISYQHSCQPKSKAQQLLGGKLIVSQLKPGKLCLILMLLSLCTQKQAYSYTEVRTVQ